MKVPNQLQTLTDLYHYFDALVENDLDADTLFASCYIRGFVSVEAAAFGDDQQSLTDNLLQAVSNKMSQAKSELSPQDSAIVHNFWLVLQNTIKPS